MSQQVQLRPHRPLIRRRHLIPVNKESVNRKIIEFIELSAPDNTKRAYLSDWEDFVAWCTVNQVQSLPATPGTVQGYISYLAELDDEHRYKTSTIARRLASISIAHQAKKYPTPTQSFEVRSVWKGIRRKYGIMQVGKEPLLANHIYRLLSHIDTRTLRGLRDRAVILVGYAGAFRRSELVSLDLPDIDFREDGMVITLRRSKTDQEGAGRYVGIRRGQSRDTCPVAALEDWLEQAWIMDGPVFRKVSKADNVEPRGLTGQAVSLIVKRCAKAAGLDPDKFGAHSLRSGFATQAAMNGSNELEIMEQTGHRSLATVRRYIKKGNIFMNNASGNIGL